MDMKGHVFKHVVVNMSMEIGETVVKQDYRVLQGKKTNKEKYGWPFKIENPKRIVVTDLYNTLSY